MQNKETIAIMKRTKLGTAKTIFYPKNSNAVRKYEMKSRERVIHSGGTRFGKFPK